MVRQILRLKQAASRSLLRSVRELHIILRQKMDHDSLDLICGKEATRTSVAAVSKGHARRIGGRVLRFPRCGSLLRGRLGGGGRGPAVADLGKAEPLECVGGGIEAWIHGDGLGWYADGRVGGDDEAVAKLVIASDDALEGNY